MKHTLWILALLVPGIAAVDMAFALPRFASRTAAKCQSCHVNPSGGGMRQTFGVTYGRNQLPVPTWSEELDLEDFSTQLTDFVSIGANFRTLFFHFDSGSSSTNAFFQMQGDIYMNLKLAKKVSIYLDKGLYAGFEIFGLLNLLPANGYIKVGKFLPNFGTKMDEHRAFIRTFTGFNPEFGRAELTGAEVAVLPGPLTIMGGIYNARDGFGAGTGKDKAYLGRADAIFKATSDIHVGIGGNVFRRENSTGPKITLLGGLGSVSVKDLTLFGEVDLMRTEVAGTTTDALITYAELNYVLMQGLDLKFAYDFFDPDKDTKSGTFSRYTFGFEFFPVSGVEVRPLYRILKEDPIDVDNNEFHLLFHFYL